MLEHTIKTSQNNEWKIVSDDVDVLAHFNDPENHINTITRQICEEGMYHPIFLGKSNMTVLDLGANCGLFSLYAADSCKQVVAVEAAWPGNLGINREQLAGIFQKCGYQTENVIHDQLFAWR